MSDPERRPHNSAATLDTTTVPLLAPREALDRLLGPHGLDPAAPHDCPDGRHPVVIDLWHVQGGRAEIGGVDQHRLSEAAVATAAAWAGASAGAAAGAGLGALGGATAGAVLGSWGGPLGWWWGMTAGLMAGGTLGGAAGAMRSGAGAAALGARTGRRLSEETARTVGTYHEVMVAVPYVRRRGGNDRRYTFVLGMWTDNPVAIWGDQVLQCGYRKRRATITRTGGQYVVLGEESGGGVALSARTQPEAGLSETVAHGWPRPPDWLAQPLLGSLPDGRLAVTFLDRFLGAPTVRWTPVQATLQASPGLCSGLLAGLHHVLPMSPGYPWGAFQLQGLPAKVTYAEHR